MKFIPTLLAATASISTASAYWKGFNIGANNPDGSCKSQQDWTNDFNAMKSYPGYFASARVYAAGGLPIDCYTLARAVPAAIATSTQLLVGVWAEDDNHYNLEKQALLSAIQTYGCGWMVSVSVGSEDLYRGDTTVQRLAQQVNDVRGMLSTVQGCSAVQVGHVDTWTAWVNTSRPTNDLIKACDFVGTNGFPYFQNTQDNRIENAQGLFWDSVNAVRNLVNTVKPGTWVWITETGWPVSGPTYGNAVANVANAQTYWNEVACAAFQQAHTFWYALQDYTSSPSFGVAQADVTKNTINLQC